MKLSKKSNQKSFSGVNPSSWSVLKSRFITSLFLVLGFSVLLFCLGNLSYPIGGQAAFRIFSYVSYALLIVLGTWGFWEYTNVILKDKENHKKFLLMMTFLSFAVFLLTANFNLLNGENTLFFDNSSLSSGILLGKIVFSFAGVLFSYLVVRIFCNVNLNIWIYVPMFIIIASPSFIYYLATHLRFIDFMLFIMIAIAFDVFGYFGGKSFGVKKAFPQISPTKTVAGYVLGIIAATFITFTLAGIIFLSNRRLILILNSPSRIYVTLIIYIFLSFIAGAGDLVFSKAKRLLKIKDYAKTLPGHGGLLDRLDGILTVLTIGAPLTLFLTLD